MNNKIILLFFSICFIGGCASKGPIAVLSEAKQEDSQHAWRSQAPKAGKPRSIKIGEYKSFDLPNGLHVIVVENNKLPIVSYQISLKNDPIDEGDQFGAVDFAGELLTKGTKNRTKAELDEEIDFIGGTLSSSSNGLFASSLKKHSTKLLELLSDVLYHPAFPEDEFNKLITQTKSGLATVKTDANAMSANVSKVLNFGKDHPYGRVQTPQQLEKVKLESCIAYYNTFFRPNNAVLIIVGDIDIETAKSQANQYFGSWEKAEIPSFELSKPKAPLERKVSFVNRDGAVQSVINITYPIEFRIGDQDEIAALVMNNILGGGVFSGRLMQNLRESKGYTYGARSNLKRDKIIGSFSAGASVRNMVTDSAVQEFIYEMERMISTDVTAEELELAINGMAGNFARSLESPQTVANFALNTYLYKLPADYYDTYLSRLNNVGAADVKRAALKFIKPNNAHVIVVGNKDEVADKLVRFDADGLIDYYDAFGEKVDYGDISEISAQDPNKIIAKYIDKIGGEQKLKSIISLISESTANVMGQELTLTQKQQLPDKFYMGTGLGGRVMQEQIVNGDKARISQMGSAQILKSGDEGFETLSSQVAIFRQLEYNNPSKFTIEVKGKEDINGDQCYKLAVKDAFGNTTFEYYSELTGLLLRSSTTQNMGENASTITTDYLDYQDVDGVLLPHKFVITGAMPIPLEVVVQSYSVNVPIDAEVFKVE